MPMLLAPAKGSGAEWLERAAASFGYNTWQLSYCFPRYRRSRAALNLNLKWLC
jgi:hypothetical protein